MIDFQDKMLLWVFDFVSAWIQIFESIVMILSLCFIRPQWSFYFALFMLEKQAELRERKRKENDR